jgi:hypothetical protein
MPGVLVLHGAVGPASEMLHQVAVPPGDQEPADERALQTAEAPAMVAAHPMGRPHALSGPLCIDFPDDGTGACRAAGVKRNDATYVRQDQSVEDNRHGQHRSSATATARLRVNCVESVSGGASVEPEARTGEAKGADPARVLKSIRQPRSALSPPTTSTASVKPCRSPRLQATTGAPQQSGPLQTPR